MVLPIAPIAVSVGLMVWQQNRKPRRAFGNPPSFRNLRPYFMFLTVALDPEAEAERAEQTVRNSTSLPQSTDGDSGAREDSRLAELEREVKRLTEENTALFEEVIELRNGMRVSIH